MSRVGFPRSRYVRTEDNLLWHSDLMTDEGHNVPRLYRHDLEGYTWILPWVFLQYDEQNTEHETKQTWLWKSPSLDDARKAKQDFLLTVRDSRPQPKWESQWGLVHRMRKIFLDIHVMFKIKCEEQKLWSQDGASVDTEDPAPVPELSDEELYDWFWREVEDYYGSLGPEGVEQLTTIRQDLRLEVSVHVIANTYMS
ncbi:hypothetical protein OH76DRAFT_1020088 [Lentinus brumalis]|uniref:Fungal-type protein kinase domain-containing protein n=1 Tax=Lentinus brumalis TaxID=2498619 RepID=A0A371CXW6_9APHY|nr:hypothetical protein OH76DRAFT_1020088 [Polyporus brumalis]